jgi:hypothetical protein
VKNIFLIIIALSFCLEGKSQDLESKNIQPATTALPIEPLRKLPSPFILDSIFSEERSLDYSTIIYYPKSNDEGVNNLVKQVIDQQISLHKPDNNEGASFEMWIDSLKISANLIHCLFVQTSYYSGAAHSNNYYFTLNFDPIKKKRILFTDIFKFSKRNNKQSFCNKINGYANGIDDSDGYNTLFTPEDINKDLDFDIIGKELIIYLDYCCAMERTILKAKLQLFQGYIDPILGKEYGLIKK